MLLIVLLVALAGCFSVDLRRDTPNVDADMCPLCIQTMGETINELLNVILNVGVIGSCGDLCNYLGKYGQIVVVACDLLCDYAGIEAFIWLIEKAELDPIWMCQEIKLCPIHDCTLDVCAKFTADTTFSPNPFKYGDTVDMHYTFSVFDQTGTGEILLAIHQSKESFPGLVDYSELVAKGFEKGDFTLDLNVQFVNEEGDFPIIFKPGDYQAHLHLCEGMCDCEKHSHTREIAENWGNFTMI